MKGWRTRVNECNRDISPISRRLNIFRVADYPLLSRRSHRAWSIAFHFAGVVRDVVDTAAAFIDSLLRVWAKGASHVDDATLVDPGGGDRFWGLVLFAPAFEHSELIKLIGAGPSPAVIHPRD